MINYTGYEIVKILNNKAVLIREYYRIKPYSCIYEEHNGIFSEVMNCEMDSEDKMIRYYLEGKK